MSARRRRAGGFAVLLALLAMWAPLGAYANAVLVDLSAYYNVWAFQYDGKRPVNGGFDNGGNAYSENLAGASVSWNGMTFPLGGAGGASAVSSATIALPTGSYVTLNVVGAAVNGAQTGTFTVNYTDGSSVSFTQSLSDWCVTSNPSGQTLLASMPYRVGPNGQTGPLGCPDPVMIYGYSFVLNTAKTVASVTLPANRNIVVLAMDVVVPAPDHYAVFTPGTAVNCQPASVTVNAHDSLHRTIAATGTITLTTSTRHGDWSLASGGGSFVPGPSNGGTATYSFAASDAGTAVFALRDTYAETVTISASDGTASTTTGTASASEDLPLTFVPSGFRFTNGANVPVSIGTQRAGLASTQALALQAVRTDTQTGACTAAFASGQTVAVGVAYQCTNPGVCATGQTFGLTNNGSTTAIAANPASGVSTYTTVPLKFSTANAEAPFSVIYTDVGQVTLSFRYALPLANGTSSANAMVGAGQFVVQPYTLALSNIQATGSGAANPAASTATGPVFIAAGQPFSATVTALNLQGAATPSFGRESSPAVVALTPTLVLPATGHDPPVAGSFGAFSGGVATGTAFNWPEVGVVTLTPGVANYLGSGAVNGTTSGNVGRFVPTSFATALNTPVFGTACAAGGFTYIGQPFTYTVPPVITVTAQAVGGAITQNYTGALMRLSNLALTGRAYTSTPASAVLDLTGLPPTSADPAITDKGGGVVTLTYGAGSGIAVARGTPVAPFSANIALSQNVIDLDGVAAGNPIVFGAGAGIAFSTGGTQYYGRLALRNALGSELLDLPMSLTTQYYVNGNVGFATNVGDSCSVAPRIAFSGYQQNLTSGATCVRDSGAPGASGAGCAAPATNRYAPTAVAGAFNLILAAPGSGHNGAVTVTASGPAWLQFPWSSAVGNANPTGFATFGEFPGPPSRVHQREVY